MTKAVGWGAVLLFLGIPGSAQEPPPAPVDPPAAEAVSAPPVPPPEAKKVSVELGGLLHVQFETGDRGDSRFADADDRFYLRRARLNAQGRFLEDFDFRVEFDLAGVIAESSGLRAQLTDGFATWTRYPGATIRFGQFKTPFGFEQLVADPRLLIVERSLANDRLTIGRQLGVQVGGELAGKRLLYSIGAFNGNGGNNNFNDNEKFLVAGRLAGLAWQGGSTAEPAGWSLAANSFSSEDTASNQPPEFGFDSTPATPGQDNLFTGRRTGVGVDSQFRSRRFEIAVEYLRVRWQPEATGIEVESDGGYVQSLWSFGEGRVQLLAKFEQFDPRADRPLDATSTWTGGFNWYIKGHDLKLVTNVQRVDVDGLDEQTKLLTRFQVAF